MTDPIDEFESMFKKADREEFRLHEHTFETVTIVTDGTQQSAEALQKQVVTFLPILEQTCNWVLITGEDFQNVGELLTKHSDSPGDLIVTFRHLHEASLIPQHSLGVYLDVLTQMTPQPVLVLPGTAGHPIILEGKKCRRVMVVTDHIAGNHDLVNHGVSCCDNGELWLCHIEDDVVFERYLEVIAKIPEIDTETARIKIDEQLLKEADQFIQSCLEVLEKWRPGISVQSVVQRGHRLKQYLELVEYHKIDLLVLNTKDEEQLAMHGLAYPLSVELLSIPLLLL